MISARDLALAVAADLGPDVEAAVVSPPADDKTRAFGIAETAAVGGFLVQCAQMALQIWQAKNDRGLLVAALANSEQLMEAYPRLDPEKRMGVMARVLCKMLPTSFETALDIRARRSVAEKQSWITDYIESRRKAAGISPLSNLATRDFHGGATILLPFADQQWWALWQSVGWIPGDEDGPGLLRVEIPKGFVTDLASVPNYL